MFESLGGSVCTGLPAFNFDMVSDTQGRVSPTVPSQKASDTRHKSDVRRLDERVGGLETRMGNVESRLGNVESRLGNVERELSEVKQSVARIEQAVTGR